MSQRGSTIKRGKTWTAYWFTPTTRRRASAASTPRVGSPGETTPAST